MSQKYSGGMDEISRALWHRKMVAKQERLRAHDKAIERIGGVSDAYRALAALDDLNNERIIALLAPSKAP